MTARRVVFTPEAQQQLIDLRRYVAGVATPEISRRYTAAIIDYCETLASLPLRHDAR